MNPRPAGSPRPHFLLGPPSIHSAAQFKSQPFIASKLAARRKSTLPQPPTSPRAHASHRFSTHRASNCAGESFQFFPMTL